MVCVRKLQVVQGHGRMKFEAGVARGVWVTGSHDLLVRAPHLITREYDNPESHSDLPQVTRPVSG